MKNLPFHALYIAIIIILSYQLWSKTTMSNQAFEEVGLVLDKNQVILDTYISNLKNGIKKNIDAYRSPSNIAFYNKFKKIDSLSLLKIQYIDNKLLNDNKFWYQCIMQA